MNGMGPPVEPGHIAHGARAQMLVAFRRAIARTVRNTHEGDVAGGRILVPVAAEESRDPPPVPALGALLVLFQFVAGHGKILLCLKREVCLPAFALSGNLGK